MLIDLNLLVKPHLSILDAVVTLEGVGPTIGEPRHLGWLAASDDTFALDFFAVHMLGVEQNGVHTVRRAIHHGIGPDKMGQIRVSGAPMKGLAVKDFDNARTPPPPGSDIGRLTAIRRRMRHNYLLKHFSIEPHAGKDCDACGDCVEACPVDVVRVSNGSVELGGDGCIRCYSCAYVCPRDAIYEKPSLFSRRLA
jgi:ferredoxin